MRPSGAKEVEVLTGSFSTPWGDGVLSVSDGELAGVELPPVGEAYLSEPGVRPDAATSAALARWTRELEAYFRGERLAWRAHEVPFEHLAFGAFHLTVYQTLLSVPPAVTVSYGVLAEMAGFPRAARAVGTAMATNPIPIVIPCHRVIRSDGSLGNYGRDSTWKQRLLAHEREHLDLGVAAG